jgi:hypothetical protein
MKNLLIFHFLQDPTIAFICGFFAGGVLIHMLKGILLEVEQIEFLSNKSI